MAKRSKTIAMLCAVATVLAAVCTRPASSAEQSFAVEPEDRSAIVDDTVSLPCRVADLAGQLQWTKDDFALGTNRNLSYHGYPRYTMTGSDSNGEYNLKLSPVTLDDDGVYQCQVGVGKRDEPAIRSRKATLTVLVAPDRPRILQGETVVTAENAPLELECVSDGGKPPAEITWTDGSGTAITEGIRTYIEAMGIDSRRFTTRSVLSFVPKMEHHNTSITCNAHNSAVDRKSPLLAKIRLLVKFAPKISLTVAGPARKLTEGSDVQFLCLAKANPTEVTYRWFVNDQFALGESTSELWLVNVTRRLHNSYVRCEVQNSVDKAEESKVLNILYKPQFKNRPKNIQADSGSHVSLLCDVDSNPPASVEWMFEKTKKVIGASSNLTLVVSSATAGRYRCKASAPGFGEVSAEVSVTVKSSPAIGSPRVQYGTPSDTVRLECVASSVPVADRIVWSYQGTVIGTRNDQNYYSVLEDPTDDGVKSTLIIRNSRQEQFGAYNCTASNYYGSDSIEISLVPKRDFMLILAIVGAGGGIVIVVIILTIIGLCRRSTTQKQKKTKPGFGGGDPDAGNKESEDSSSNGSDIKMETGTGSSLSNYRYRLDNAGPDSVQTVTTTIDDQLRAATLKSGGSQTTLTRGLPLAGPVPVDPRVYATAGQYYAQSGQQTHHRPLSNGTTVADYEDPTNYVRYSTTSDRLANSNGYIAADRLYDLNPMPAATATSSSDHAAIGLSAAHARNNPAALLQYSAAYGNPYLQQRPNPGPHPWPAAAQKLDAYGRPEPPPYSAVGRAKRKTPVSTNSGGIAAVSGHVNHVGVTTAKHQTMATHV